jgi:hypothetical protein
MKTQYVTIPFPIDHKIDKVQLFPHIKHVMQKFTKHLPKEDLKKFAKEVGKKLVASDFKNNRVEDPTKISEKQEKKVKKYVREYFEKAVEKKKAIDKRKAEKLANGTHVEPSKPADGETNGMARAEVAEELPSEMAKEESDIEMSDDEDKDTSRPQLQTASASATPSFNELPTESSETLKRKREDEEIGSPGDDSESNKRLKEEDDDKSVSPPPPPPPPPADSMPIDGHELDPAQLDAAAAVNLSSTDENSLLAAHTHVKQETDEENELRLQEEELMRENEEAMMMDLDGSLNAAEKLRDGHGNGMENGIEQHEREGVLSH